MEIFKTKVGINPEIMNEIFIFKKPIYDFRKTDTLKRIKVKSVKFGTESVSYLGPKLWDLLPTEFKNIESLSKFKDKITGWDTDECPCKLCKNYIRDLGFIWSYISFDSVYVWHDGPYICVLEYVCEYLCVCVYMYVYTLYIWLRVFFSFLYISFINLICFLMFLNCVIGVN